jgi:tetratricopeptide (TPR) repeat protein
VTLLRRADAKADPDVVAGEARGHPLFLEELTRHVARGGSAKDDVKLDDAIWARVADLDPKARELAEIVVVAGKPLPQQVVAAAARVEPLEFNRFIAVLRAANLVRTGGARWADAIEPYHDRVREAVLAQLTAERKRALHEALANAFQASSQEDAETLALHWREAGNASHASRYAALAGDQAARAFAFDRAAQCYEQALALLPAGHPGRRELRVKLGDALAYAGRGALAAPHFEAAAAESPPIEALELRRRAVDQLLRTGHFDRGVEASRGVLAAIGMRMPASRFGTIAMLLWYRLLLTLRGLRFEEREKGEFTAQELARIDVCWSLGMALTFVDSAVGNAFMNRALLLALRAGEPERITRCVGIEVGFSSWSGVRYWPRTERLIAYVRELAERSGTVPARFFAIGPAGVAHYCNGRFREAATILESALEMTADGSTGLVHERVTARFFLVTSLVLLGRYKEAARIQQEGLRDAMARGDLYASVNLRVGLPNATWLASGQADVAQAQIDAAMGEWSQGAFHLEHHYALLSRVSVKLYAGDADGAYALASEHLAKTRGSLLWRIQATRLRTLHVHASAVVAKLAKVGLASREGARLREEALRDARAIEKEGAPWALPFATLARAGVALREGKRDEAIAGLDAGARGLDAADMVAHAAAARDRGARLRGGGEGEIARTAALLRGEGVVDVERFVEMLVPGMRG